MTSSFFSPTTFLAVLPTCSVEVYDGYCQWLVLNHGVHRWVYFNNGPTSFFPLGLEPLFLVLISPSWTEDEVNMVLWELGFI